MPAGTLQIKAISATPGSDSRAPACSAKRRSASTSTSRPASAARPARSRASSGTTCRSSRRTFDNTYQTMPSTAWNYWNLIKFNEHQRDDGTLHVADAQGPVHALRGSRLPARLPGRRRHRPVHQRHRRLPAGELHRLPVLRVGLPVRHSEVQQRRRRRSTSARCARIASGRGSSRRASRRVRPAA